MYRGSLDRAALATLAPLVLDAAAAGDTVCAALVEQGASELALLAAAASRSLGLGSDPVPLALAGGLLLGSADYRRQVLAALESLGIRPDPVTLVHEPAEGALRRARAYVSGG